MNCMDNCRFADWQRTKNGRLHPSGEGRCTWVMPQIVLPVFHYFIGDKQTPYGGFMNRKSLKDCPAYEAAAKITDNRR